MSLMNDGGGLPAVMNVEPAGSNNNNGGGWGGDWSAWIIIFVLFFAFGGWGNGFGGFGGSNGSGALTRADLCQDMNFGQVQDGVRGIQQGICDSTFALNNTVVNGFNGVQRDMCTGFANVNAGISENRFATQQGFNATQVAMMQGQNALSTQLAQCCCENRQGQADIKYQMAADTCAIQNTMQNTTRDIIDNQNSGFRAILDKMCQQEIAAKDAQIAAQNQRIFGLELSASQQAQNNYLVSQLAPKCPVPAFLTCNPYTGQTYTNGYGYGSSCGCGCNG